MALTPEQVIKKEFPETRARRGYDREQVDLFLDEVVVELRRLNKENDQLRQQLLEAGIEPLTGERIGTEAGAAGSEIDVKKLFAAQCAWCHADYGLKPGKAPQLAGTKMTEKQVADRIRNGKTDAMPGFRRTLTEEQIQAFAQYIKGLKVPE